MYSTRVVELHFVTNYILLQLLMVVLEIHFTELALTINPQRPERITSIKTYFDYLTAGIPENTYGFRIACGTDKVTKTK